MFKREGAGPARTRPEWEYQISEFGNIFEIFHSKTIFFAHTFLNSRLISKKRKVLRWIISAL